jgi:hypothetical protein
MAGSEPFTMGWLHLHGFAHTIFREKADFWRQLSLASGGTLCGTHFWNNY